MVDWFDLSWRSLIQAGELFLGSHGPARCGVPCVVVRVVWVLLARAPEALGVITQEVPSHVLCGVRRVNYCREVAA